MSDEQQTEDRVYTYEDLAEAQRRWARAEADTKYFEAKVYESEAAHLRVIAGLAQARADETRALANVKATRDKWMESGCQAKAIAALEPAPAAVKPADDQPHDGEFGDEADEGVEVPSVEVPDALSEFMKLPGAVKWEGGECPVHPDAMVEFAYALGDRPYPLGISRKPERAGDEREVNWTGREKEISAGTTLAYVIAYRILTPAAPEEPEQVVDAKEFEGDATAKAVLDAMVDKAFADITLSDDTAAVETYMDGDELVVREISADEFFAPADAPEPTELDAPASIVDDPELQAAVARAEATLAAETPAYVGLQDADLDAEYDAMKAREAAEEKAKPKFSIWGGKREKVDA